jgi:hypothetical protein
LGPCHLGLEGLYRVTVLFPDVFLDVFFKYYYGITVLLSLAERALVRRFKPCEDAFGMKHVLAREAALDPLGDFVKTNDTSLGKVGRTLALLARHVFALGAPYRHGGAPLSVHYEIELLKFWHEFPQEGLKRRGRARDRALS